MGDDQQINLKWRSHQSTLISSFDTFLQNGSLVDCTLAAEGKFLKAHKLVLSACSPYFATLLDQQFDKHPIFILRDIKFDQIKAIMDYMYRGEMIIDEDLLPSILKAANSLEIKGLSSNRTSTESPTPEANKPPALSFEPSQSENTAIPKRRYKSASSSSKVTFPPSRTTFPPSLQQRQMKAKQPLLNYEKHKLAEFDPEIVYPKMDIDSEKEDLKPSEAVLLPISAEPPSNYVCQRCGRAYISLTSLGRHKRVECNKKPALKCPNCIYKSSYKWNLKRHMMKYHKSKFTEEIFEAIIRRTKQINNNF